MSLRIFGPSSPALRCPDPEASALRKSGSAKPAKGSSDAVGQCPVIVKINGFDQGKSIIRPGPGPEVPLSPDFEQTEAIVGQYPHHRRGAAGDFDQQSARIRGITDLRRTNCHPQRQKVPEQPLARRQCLAKLLVGRTRTRVIFLLKKVPRNLQRHRLRRSNCRVRVPYRLRNMLVSSGRRLGHGRSLKIGDDVTTGWRSRASGDCQRVPDQHIYKHRRNRDYAHGEDFLNGRSFPQIHLERKTTQRRSHQSTLPGACRNPRPRRTHRAPRAPPGSPEPEYPPNW